MVALLAASVAFAAPELRLEVQPTALVEGQSGTASLLVVGDTRGVANNVQWPNQLPAGAGLRVTYASQGQTYRNRNGRITQVIELAYQVAAIEPGDWLVGPVDLTLDDGTTLSAASVTVHVRDRASVPVQDEVAWVDAGFVVDHAWEGQVVVYAYKLTTRAVSPVVEWQMPPFDGLRLPQHGTDTNQTYEVASPDGPLTIEEGAIPWVATAPGRRTLPPAAASVRVPLRARDIFGFGRLTAPDVYTGKPSVLEVDPLPTAPPGFTGIVGDVTVTSTLEQTSAAVGASVGWTVRIQGDASLDGFKLPPYAADGVSVYDDDTTVDGHIEGTAYRSDGSFHRVLVPTHEGTVELPSWTLVTFSPTERRYVTHDVALGTLQVTPGREGKSELQRFGAPQSSPVAESDEPAIDLREPYATGRASAPSLAAALPPLLVAAALPGLGLLLAEGVGWVRARRAKRVVRPAPPRARTVLARLPDDPDDRLAALDHALHLLEAQAPDDPDLRALRQRLGRARFGGMEPDPTLSADIAAAAERVEASSSSSSSSGRAA